MRTRKYRGGKKRSMKAGCRKSYRGGQPRWPAPSNPTPAPSCWFPHFRPLLLSQFGGRKKSKKILKKITEGKTIKDKYYGIQAMNKIKELFFPNNKKEADKWANRWTNDEKKKSVYITYFVKKNKHAKFIIGEGKRLSVLGQKNINKKKSRKHKGANGDSPTSVIDGPYSHPPQHPNYQGNQSLAEQYGFGGLNEYGSMAQH